MFVKYIFVKISLDTFETLCKVKIFKSDYRRNSDCKKLKVSIISIF